MIRLEGDQDVAIHAANGAGVAVREVDARDRQADVVDQALNIARGNHLAHGSLDVIDEHCRFLYAHSGRTSDMQLDLAAVDLRKEIPAEKRIDEHRGGRGTQEHHCEGPAMPESHRQEGLVATANDLEAP